VSNSLVSALAGYDMILDHQKTAEVMSQVPHFELANSRLHSLIARSQEDATAVFALTDE
jgi:hypothetical protein